MHSLTPEMMTVFALISCTMVLLVLEWVRIDVCACLMLVTLGITHVLPTEVLFSGFSSNAVISIIAIMIMVAGLERSGLIQEWTQRLLMHKETRVSSLRALLMVMAGCLGAMMRSEGAVSILLPVTSSIAKRTGMSKGLFLLPISYCAIMGSMVTMIGAGPLILVNTMLSHSFSIFPLFFVVPVGLGLWLCGFLYFVLWGSWLLPPRPVRIPSHQSTLEYFKRAYGCGGNFFEVVLLETCPWLEHPLRDLESVVDDRFTIVGLYTGHQMHFPPLRTQELRADMRLAILGDYQSIMAMAPELGFRVEEDISVFMDVLHPSQSGLCEAVIPPSSHWVDLPMRDLHMRRNHRVQILSVHRGSKIIRGSAMQEMTLRTGDTLGMICQWSVLQDLESQPDVVILTSDYPKEDDYSHREYRALAILIASLLLVWLEIIPFSVALLGGALSMIVMRVLTMDEAYQAISWKTVFLLAGMLPLGLALTRTGGAMWLSEHLYSVVSHWTAFEVELLLACIATGLGMVVSNSGATIVLVPVGIELAQQLGADPRHFALLIAFMASNIFVLPHHPAHVLIMGPGRYQLRDFIRAGSFFSFIYGIVVIGLLHIIF